MRVYIAAPYPIQKDAYILRGFLADYGVECTSRWLTDPSEALNDEWARKDLADVARCDALVALNPDEWKNSGTGGRHVELGYALALRKPVYIIGVRSNIFHELSEVTIVSNREELVDAINACELAAL